MQSGITRRTFVTGLALGAGAVVVRSVSAGAADVAAPVQRPSVLAGHEFALTARRALVNVTGRPRLAHTVNGSLPAPTLRWREGDAVTVRVSNEIPDHDTSIHWHGIVLPADMDGVPGLSFDGIAPGQTFTYRFPVRQAGTYWYHSHSASQEQRGLYGALIIEPRDPEPFQYDREHVVLLSDWTDERPERILRKLKKRSDYYNFRQQTVADLFRDVRDRGLGPTLRDRWDWGVMRMNPTDLSDVSGYTYTHLMNGLPPAANWTGLFAPGERVRLRIINGSSMTYFDVRIPGLAMTVVAADGQYVRPVVVDELRVAVAETFDVLVEPSGQEAYTIFAQAMDRTAYARGSLAVRDGLAAAIPPMDRRQRLTMVDMGHGMAPGGGDHATMDHATMDHGAHAGHDMAMRPTVTHPASERGNPLVDMQARAPVARLDDPGVGLRDNGRRVLTYADLHSTFDDPDGREPTTTVELHLTGHMERFSWSFNGVKFSAAEPIRLKFGERVRVVLVNDSMMSHPIHLHGMWSDLEDDAGRFQVRKHTIDMPPGTRRTYRVTADALGRWAYHCHLLFHMEIGMFREVRVVE